MSNSVFWLIFAAMLALGIVFGIIPLVKCLQRKKRCTKSVDAEITGYSDKRSGFVENNRHYNAEYRYLYNGIEYNASGVPLFSKSGATGIHKTIFVNPMKPDEIFEPDDLKNRVGSSAFVLFVTLAIAAVVGSSLMPNSDAKFSITRFISTAFPIAIFAAFIVPITIAIVMSFRKSKRCTYEVKGVIAGYEQREEWVNEHSAGSDTSNSVKRTFYIERLKFYYNGIEYDADGYRAPDTSFLGKVGDVREMLVNPNDLSEYKIKRQKLQLDPSGAKSCLSIIVVVLVVVVGFGIWIHYMMHPH